MSNFSDLSVINESYTMADLEIYGTRLHINSVIILIFNLFTGHIVLKYSTESMGKYKYYILFTLISATLMDLDATVIFGIYPTFPLPGFCGAGIVARHLNWFWGEVIQYLILQEIFSICGASLLFCFLYRYAVMTGKVEFFHSWKGIIIMTTFMLLFPLGPTIALFATLENRDEILEYIQERAPNMYDLYKSGPCSCFRNETAGPFIYVSCGHIIAMGAVGNCVVIKTWRLMAAARTSLSSSTYKMYREFIVSLIVQSTVPTFFLVFPSAVAGILVLTQSGNSKTFAFYAFQGLFFHSVMNCLCIILMIKVYREAAKKILLKPFGCYKPPTTQAFVSPTSTGNVLSMI